MTRDPGSLDPVYLRGRARDLYTAPDTIAKVLATAALTATVDMVPRVVQHLDVDPPVPGLHLVGGPAMSGFRNTVDKVAPELRARRDLRYTLLDDVPVATLISGHALAASGVLGKASTGGYLPVADQCAGFVTGGLLMSSFARDEPTVVPGPTAPDLRDPADPWCWHDMAELPVHGMRRCRRLDVSPVDDGRTVLIDAMFRDTYVRADGVETIIHEYTLDAAVEPVSGVILRSEATPRVLPWQECPGASPARAGSPACDSTSCTAECATNCTAPRPAPTSTTCCAASPTPQPLSLSCPPNSTRTEEQCRFR